MIYRRFQRPLTGIDIGNKEVKIVQILKGKKGWRLLEVNSIPLPEDCLKLSLRTGNINEPQAFLNVFRELIETFGRKFHRAGVSIPCEVVKVFMKRYANLPKSLQEAEKMIEWMGKKSVPFPAEKITISHYPIGGKTGSVRTFLIALAFHSVIREYELNLRELRIEPEIIRPAGVNHLNFYSARIPRTGTVAFLGVFENYFTFFVMVHGLISFYHGVKRGFSDIHFFQDIDMTINLFENDNPGTKIEKIFFGSQVGFGRSLEEGLKSLGEIEIVRMREAELISTEELTAELNANELCRYAAAIGAAQSLVQ